MAVISELESKIIRQVEYYFGDHNLGRDKFLQEEIKKDEGWISLEGTELSSHIITVWNELIERSLFPLKTEESIPFINFHFLSHDEIQPFGSVIKGGSGDRGRSRKIFQRLARGIDYR